MTDPQTPESNPPEAQHPKRPTRGWGCRTLRWLGGLVAFLLVIVLALAGWLVWAIHSQSGTAQLWALATRFGNAYVSGKLEGGTVRDGVSLRDLHVRAGSTEVRIDHVEGRWAITRGPWHAHFAYLRAGNVDVILHPTPPIPPSGPPNSLVLPLALDVDRLAVDRLAIRQGTSTTELKSIAGSLHTDGTHHNVLLDGMETPAGKLAATLRMTGTRPYPLTGAATLATQFEVNGQKQDASVSAQLSGSLETLHIDATGTGAKLTAQALIDATPFGALPLSRAVVSAEHVNPRAFAPGAPEASLSIHADLRPDEKAKTLTVAGPIEIDNAQPGTLDKQKLPLQSLRAQVRLNENDQQLTGLDVRLLGGAVLTGGADVQKGHGALRVDVRQLDLQALHASLERTKLAGPITVDFAGGTQRVALDLAGGDMRAQAKAVLDAAQVAVESAQVSLGRSRLTLAGTLKHDDAQSFAFKGNLAEFDPSRLAKVAKGRINAEFDARGTLGEPIDAAVKFAVRDSNYAGLPMTGDGNVHLRGERLLPSDARLDVAGNKASLRGSFGGAARPHARRHRCTATRTPATWGEWGAHPVWRCLRHDQAPASGCHVPRQSACLSRKQDRHRQRPGADPRRHRWALAVRADRAACDGPEPVVARNTCHAGGHAPRPPLPRRRRRQRAQPAVQVRPGRRRRADARQGRRWVGWHDLYAVGAGCAQPATHGTGAAVGGAGPPDDGPR